ncbi:MAG TPA: glycerol-3-phosphate 1-O-acyltransferase PlsY [Gemmatimonadaceae bacterium]|nr:glycerol-3-phosphate 1-O-acyltransferase PlsY [Gemmatimonadaceae bacterium]
MTAGALPLLLAAYACGSFPSAYLAGRALKGIDLRRVGSGNLGTTNVYRELGAAPAAVVLLLDAAKGAVPSLAFPRLLVPTDDATVAMWWAFGFGFAAIIGHAKPVFLLWKGGGKGVATAAGVFFAVTPTAATFALGAFLLVVSATRYVSLASMIAAATLPVAELLLGAPMPAVAASVAVALLVVVSHRGNLQRLMAGTERRLGRPGSASS